MHWDKRVVVFEYFGVVDSFDFLESNRDVYGDDRFDGLRFQVVLFDQVTEVNYSPKDVKKIAYLDMAAYRSNPHVTVLFTGDSSLLKKLNSLYSTYVEGRAWPSQFFKNREDVWAQITEKEKDFALKITY